MRRAIIVTVTLAALAAPARAQALRHALPERDAEVPIQGSPTWVEDLTTGTPLSDFGSHAGVKATVTTDGPVAARSLLDLAWYDAFQPVAAQVDQSAVWVAEALPGGGERALFSPPDERRVTFHPWGWEETARQGDLTARGAVTTLATDVFLVVCTLENHGVAPRVLAPRLCVFDDADPVHESMQPLQLSWIQGWRAEHDRAHGTAILGYRRGTPFDAFAWDRMRLVRAVAPVGAALTRVRGGLRPFVQDTGRWSTTLELASTPVAPGASLTLAFVVGCGEDRAEAERTLARGQALVGRDPLGALARLQAAWARDLAALPHAHAASPDEARLYETAYTGLRMNRFARRGRLSADCDTAAKVHFNTFFVWDVAIAAWAAREWDPAGARRSLLALFRAQQPEGHLHYTVDADLQPVSGLIRMTTQAPVHGWVIDRLRVGADRAWLAEVYDRSGRWLAFFERERDADGDGLFGYASALETGWDDTPRYPTLRPTPRIDLFGLRVDLGNLSGLLPMTQIDALDLSCWLFSYYGAMSRLAEDLGRPAAEVAGWRAKAAALSARIEASLWDPLTRTYRDMRVSPAGLTPVRVDTPVVAWPLFLGACRDPDRARATLDDTLLDPRRFFGDPDDPVRPRFPMPSVAYTDPEYDRANDGYYWRGQAWLLPAYAACEALFKYGREAEGRELRRRVLRAVIRAHPNGIHETYDALEDRIGFGSGSLTGAGEPAAFLIGLSCAPLVELLLDRHERERLLGPRDAAFEGYVAEARALSTDAVYYRASAASGQEVPRARLATRSGAPLVGPGPAPALELVLDDPHGNLPPGPVRVELALHAGFVAWAVDAAGLARPLAAAAPGPGLAFDADRATAVRWLIVPAGTTP